MYFTYLYYKNYILIIEKKNLENTEKLKGEKQ